MAIVFSKAHPAITSMYTTLFFRDRGFFLATLFAWLSHSVLWILLLWRFNIVYQGGRDYIALHYKVVFGVDWLGQWYSIFLLPMTGMIIIVTHYLLAKHSYHQQKTFVYLLMGSAIACQCVLVFALSLIIQANFF